MNRCLLMVLLCALFAGPVLAGDAVELQIVNGQPTFDIFVTGSVRGKIGWSAFALVNRGWAEVYVGPTFAPTAWSEVSLSAGIETGGNRFSESLWLGKDRVSMLAIREHGHSETWYKIVAEYELSKGFAVGYHHQSFRGDGPRVSYTRGKVKIWSSLLFTNDDTNVFVAIKVG